MEVGIMKTYNEPVDIIAEKQEIENEKKLAIEDIDGKTPPLVDRTKAIYLSFLFGLIFLIALLLAIFI
jgi:hypothetical protein